MLQHFLKSIDVFGAEVGIKYEGQNKYTSRVGGFATLLVGSLIFALLYQQLMQIYSREDPNVIFQQTHVDNPSKYETSPDKFSIMFGLHDATNQPAMDEQIFTIEAAFDYKVKQFYANGTSHFVITSIPLIVKPCGIEDFQMVEVEDYFKNLPFQNYYCIKNQTNTYLQGQFEKEVYSTIKIRVKECVNATTCKDQKVRQTFLKSSKFQIYYTNRIMDMQNYEKPFKAVGQTTFYQMFYDYYLITNLIFTNTFVVDDDGLFLKNQKTQKDLLFTTERFQLQTKNNAYLLQCVLYLQKDKEDYYKRNYQKITQVLSQLGGTFQILFILGCIFIRPYNKLQLQNRLYEDIFSGENHNILNVSTLQKQNSPNFSSQQIQASNKQKMRTNPQDHYMTKSSLKQDTIINKSSEQPKKPTEFNFFTRFMNKCFFQTCSNLKSQKNYIENLRSLKSIMSMQIKFKSLYNLYSGSQHLINNDDNFQQLKQSKIINSAMQQSHQNTYNEFGPQEKICSPLKGVKKYKSSSSICLHNSERKEQHKCAQFKQQLESRIARRDNKDDQTYSKKLLEQSKTFKDCDSPTNQMQQQSFSPINKSLFLSKYQQDKMKLDEYEPNINMSDLEIVEPSIQYKQDSYIQSFQLLNSLSYKKRASNIKNDQNQ